VIRGATEEKIWSGADGPQRPLVGERPHSLAEVLGAEAGSAKLDQLALDVRVQLGAGVEDGTDHALVASLRERRARGDLPRPCERLLGEVLGLGDGVDEPPSPCCPRIDPAADQEQLPGPRGADRVDELANPGVGVDQAELRRRHCQWDRRGSDAQVTRQCQLEATADRRAVERRQRGVGIGLDRRDRVGERIRHQLLGLIGEYLVAHVADVVARRERVALSGDDHAPRIERRHRGRERVEDRLVQRAAFLGMGDGQPGNVRRRFVEQQPASTAGSRLLTQGQRACRPRRRTGLPRNESP
jgi:hypothetical protein